MKTLPTLCTGEGYCLPSACPSPEWTLQFSWAILSVSTFPVASPRTLHPSSTLGLFYSFRSGCLLCSCATVSNWSLFFSLHVFSTTPVLSNNAISKPSVTSCHFEECIQASSWAIKDFQHETRPYIFGFIFTWASHACQSQWCPGNSSVLLGIPVSFYTCRDIFLYWSPWQCPLCLSRLSFILPHSEWSEAERFNNFFALCFCHWGPFLILSI